MTFHSNENEKKKMARGIISQIKPVKSWLTRFRGTRNFWVFHPSQPARFDCTDFHSEVNSSYPTLQIILSAMNTKWLLFQSGDSQTNIGQSISNPWDGSSSVPKRSRSDLSTHERICYRQILFLAFKLKQDTCIWYEIIEVLPTTYVDLNIQNIYLSGPFNG